MRRFLVVANQTLSSPELWEVMRSKAAGGDCAFHLVVPILHTGSGMMWTEGQARGAARRRLDETLERMTGAGFVVGGEVGGDSPVDAVDDALRRDGAENFDGVIVSTLPHAVSRWLKIDAPSRIQRKTSLPVEHVIGHPSEVDA